MAPKEERANRNVCSDANTREAVCFSMAHGRGARQGVESQEAEKTCCA